MNNKNIINFMESMNNLAKTSNNFNKKNVAFSKNNLGGIFNKKKNKTKNK